jgi:CheY-like chemotaxis protein
VRYPLRVLVAEDNSVNQHVVLRMLDRMGYRADLAANGLEVLAALRRQSYDVVLMDVQMPELDGIDATRELRAMLPADRQPYVIAVTANALSGDREACLAAGMDDYISKPMQRAELESALLHAGAQRAIMPTAVAAAPTAALAMPVFQMLRESLGDDGELVRLLSLFRQQAEQDIVAMRALASAGESPLMISRLAHRLKGSGASLGADMLAQLCQTLDTYTHQGSIADAAAMIDAIEREYARVCAALDSGIDGQPAIR